MATTPFVTIAGVALGKVLADTPTIEEPELQGEWRRGDDGGVQTSERSPKRGYAFVAKFDPPSTYLDLQVAMSVVGARGVPTAVAVSSPADGLTLGEDLTCYCRLGRGQFKSTGAGATKTSYITAPVTLKEA